VFQEITPNVELLRSWHILLCWLILLMFELLQIVGNTSRSQLQRLVSRKPIIRWYCWNSQHGYSHRYAHQLCQPDFGIPHSSI